MLGLLFAAMRSRIAWVAISAELLRHCAQNDRTAARGMLTPVRPRWTLVLVWESLGACFRGRGWWAGRSS
jgi:hypothetical protein